MRTHQLNPQSLDYVWNDIWVEDVYARPAERFQRAKRRADAFDLERAISSNAAVLDIGCGSGELLGVLEERCGLLVGLDRSTTALNLAKKRNSGTRIHYLSGAAEALPLSSNFFDHVIVFGIIEHVRDHQTLISEIHRVMKPGATAFVSSSNAYSFLQAKNYMLARMGKYRYGFQQNWTAPYLKSVLQQRFRIEQSFIMQGDSDMPVTTKLDRVVGHFVPSWGRYICFVVSKRDA